MHAVNTWSKCRFISIIPGLKVSFISIIPGLNVGFICIIPGLNVGFISIIPGLNVGFSTAMVSWIYNTLNRSIFCVAEIQYFRILDNWT